MFACLFHIKEEFTHSCSYTSKGKHSLLLCRLLLRLFFGPFFSEPKKDTVSPEQAWRSSDHTRSRQRSLHDSLYFSPSSPPFLPSSSFPLFLIVTRSVSLLLHYSSLTLFPHFIFSQASLTQGEQRLHAHSCISLLPF